MRRRCKGVLLLDVRCSFDFVAIVGAKNHPDVMALTTTTPNELTGTGHDRMPVIFKSSDYARWLSREETD